MQNLELAAVRPKLCSTSAMAAWSRPDVVRLFRLADRQRIKESFADRSRGRRLGGGGTETSVSFISYLNMLFISK